MKTTFYIILMLSILLIEVRSQNGFRISPLNYTPIVFEKIEKGIFFKDVYTILSIYTPQNISESLKIIEKNYKKIQDICKSLPDGLIQRTWLEEIEEQSQSIIETLSENNKNIHNLFQQHNSGERVDIIEEFSFWAFGTTENEDAHKVYNNLKLIEKNKDPNLNLINDQTTLMNLNIEKSSERIKSLISNLNEIVTSLNNFTTTTNQDLVYEIKNELVKYSFTINFDLQQIKFNQKIEESILRDFNRRKLFPFVQIKGNIITVVIDLLFKAGIQPLDSDLLALYKITKVDILHDGNSLLLKLIIPLPEPTLYDALHKIYLLPTDFNEKRDLLLDIDHQYIAESTTNGTYVLLTQEEYDNCEKIMTDDIEMLVVCRHTKPILTSESNECLVELIQHSETTPKHCKWLVVSPNDKMITMMEGSNKWLYKFKKPFMLNINCSEQHSVANLTQLGTIEFHQSCKVANEEMTIPVYNLHMISTEIKTAQVDYLTLINEIKERIRANANPQKELWKNTTDIVMINWCIIFLYTTLFVILGILVVDIVKEILKN